MLQKSSLKIGTVHIAFFASRFPELRYLLHHLIPTASSQGGGKVYWQRYHARWTCPASVVILIWRQTWPVEWLQPRWTCHHHWGAHQSGDGETKTKSWKAPGGTPLREATRGICQGIYIPVLQWYVLPWENVHSIIFLRIGSDIISIFRD